MGIVQKEVSDRTLFGEFVKGVFVLFNVLMIVNFFYGIFFVGPDFMKGYKRDIAQYDLDLSEQAIENTAVGLFMMIGVGSVVFQWVLGDIILGILVLLTRRKKLITVSEE